MEKALIKIKEKNNNAYIPITIPFKLKEDIIDQNAKRILMKDNNSIDESKIFLFQFPRQISMNISSQEKEKYLESLKEDSKFDKNGYLIKPKFHHSFCGLKNNLKLGKIKFYKSGKVTITIGSTEYFINLGVYKTFNQQIAIINSDARKKAYILGQPTVNEIFLIPQITHQ